MLESGEERGELLGVMIREFDVGGERAGAGKWAKSKCSPRLLSSYLFVVAIEVESLSWGRDGW